MYFGWPIPKLNVLEWVHVETGYRTPFKADIFPRVHVLCGDSAKVIKPSDGSFKGFAEWIVIDPKEVDRFRSEAGSFEKCWWTPEKLQEHNIQFHQFRQHIDETVLRQCKDCGRVIFSFFLQKKDGTIRCFECGSKSDQVFTIYQSSDLSPFLRLLPTVQS